MSLARRWYANRHAMNRILRGEGSSTRTAWLEHWSVGLVLRFRDENGDEAAYNKVSVFSSRRIDRLARDWIGHGVTPCTSGRRGVKKPEHIPPEQLYVERGQPIEAACPGCRYDRAEARAKRVVVEAR